MSGGGQFKSGPGLPAFRIPEPQQLFEPVIQAEPEIVKPPAGVGEAGPEEPYFFPALLQAAEKLPVHGGGQAMELELQVLLAPDHEFGGGGWCGGAQVGHKVGNGKINFMADGGNDGDGGMKDGPGDDFLIKGPEVFDGAAPPGEDDDIHLGHGIEVLDGGDDFCCGALTLDSDRVEHHLDIGKPAVQNLEEIPNGGAAGRRNHCQAAGEKREGALEMGIEEAFGGQAIFQFLKGLGQGPQPQRFQIISEKLIFAPGFVDGELPPADDLEGIRRLLSQFSEITAEHDNPHLTLFVFKGKITMAGMRIPEVRDFPADPNQRELVFQMVFDQSGQVGNGVDA